MDREFGSEEWIRAVEEIREAYADHVPPEVPVPPVRVNLMLTGAPDGIGQDGTVHAHVDSSRRKNVLDTGALSDPDVTVTVDYDTAYDLVIDQRPNAILAAFLGGRIKVSGDLAGLVAQSGLDLAELPGRLAGLSGGLATATLADIHPLAGEIGARILAITDPGSVDE
jgi:hypothetical protein